MHVHRHDKKGHPTIGSRIANKNSVHVLYLLSGALFDRGNS